MDNFFQECPPLMSDGGRHLSDYQMPTRRNEYIKYVNDIVRDDQYRLLLQQNGKQMLDKEWDWHKENNTCHPNGCIHTYPTRVTPRQMWQEREAYDSINDIGTRCELENLRKCKKYDDYRLN
jgi:hypothetical protein